MQWLAAVLQACHLDPRSPPRPGPIPAATHRRVELLLARAPLARLPALLTCLAERGVGIGAKRRGVHARLEVGCYNRSHGTNETYGNTNGTNETYGDKNGTNESNADPSSELTSVMALVPPLWRLDGDAVARFHVLRRLARVFPDWRARFESQWREFVMQLQEQLGGRGSGGRSSGSSGGNNYGSGSSTSGSSGNSYGSGSSTSGNSYSSSKCDHSTYSTYSNYSNYSPYSQGMSMRAPPGLRLLQRSIYIHLHTPDRE